MAPGVIRVAAAARRTQAKTQVVKTMMRLNLWQVVSNCGGGQRVTTEHIPELPKADPTPGNIAVTFIDIIQRVVSSNVAA